MKLRPQTPLRFCLSCCGTIACWALWIVLVVVLFAQLYILAAEDLPVPDFVLRRLERKVAEANLSVSFGRAQFDPTGRVFLQDVKLSPREFGEPILRAKGIYVHKSLWSFLAGRVPPDEIRIDGATLQLPAMLSPSGAAEPLVQDLAATIRFSGGAVHVDQAAFKVGSLVVTVHGSYELPPRGAGPPVRLEDLTQQFLRMGRQVVLQIPQLDRLERPAVDIELSSDGSIGNFARITLMAEGVEGIDAFPVKVGEMQTHASLALPFNPARPLRFAFEAADIAYEQRATASRVQGLIVARLSPETRRPESAEASVAVSRIAAFGETAAAPVVHAAWRQDGRVEAAVGIELHGQLLEAGTVLDVKRRTAEINVAGTVAPAFPASALPRHAPRFEPYFQFEEPFWINARVKFAEGWKFDGLQSTARVGRLNSRGVPLTSARGQIDIAPNGDFLARDAHVTLGTFAAQGSYWMNFKSRDFRFLLTGTMQPEAISGWFRSDWWPNLWKNFQFPGDAPYSDVDVTGNWRNGSRTTYFGSTVAGASVVQGADFEQARVRVIVRPGLIHAKDLEVSRAGGAQKAAGWFARHTSGENRELRALDYDLSGKLEPEIMRKLGGEAAVSLLAPWKFSTPPDVRFHGRTTYTAGRSVPELHFTGRASDGLSYYGFPLDTVEAEGGASGNDVRLDRIELSVAGGFGRGKAALSGDTDNRKLGFDLYVAGADLVRSIRAIREFDAARDGTPPAGENSELMKRASGGKLEAAISAQGDPDNLASFVGSGNLQVKGAELGEVNLFGLLSQVLSTFSLNFSTLKLDMLQGSFRLADGRAHFPDLRVTGPNSVIDAKGDYRFIEQTLDFTAHFKPYEQGRNIITAALGMVVNPLSSIFELKLTGPLAKPNWSVSLGSSTPKPAAEAKDEPSATPPAEK